jgi:hypothetical protein
MTDNAKPQAVQPPPIWDHQGDPRCVNSGCFNVRDHWINAPDSVPAQAVGDEVDASQATKAVPPCLVCGRELKNFGPGKGWDHADPAGTSHLTLADRVRVDAMHIMSMIDHQSYRAARTIAEEMMAYMKHNVTEQSESIQ